MKRKGRFYLSAGKATHVPNSLHLQTAINGLSRLRIREERGWGKGEGQEEGGREGQREGGREREREGEREEEREYTSIHK